MRRWAALAALAALGAAEPPEASGFAADAREVDSLIAANYAYLDRFARGALADSPRLAAERAAVHDRDTLLHYAEDRIASLADHHAITGGSFPDSWALVPSYADLWIVAAPGGRYLVDAVRPGSPARAADVAPGDELVSVDGRPIAAAVAAFWAATARPATADADAYAARVLAVGRRDRPRVLGVKHGRGVRMLTLASLYADRAPPRPPLDCRRLPDAAEPDRPGRVVVHFFNSLGAQATTAAFDTCMAGLSPGERVELDLTDTPSGGDTSVARAVMSWFVDRATSYQLHQLPAEERETGVARQWIEQVLPRAGKRHTGAAEVRVGRWTGSMGEGLAIGMAAIGARLCGGPMAGLRGAVYDFRLPASGLIVKLPAERLYTIGGVPREDVKPPPCG